jgi:hypothetical protein
MFSPHLAINLGHERERELRQARESASTPRELADRHDRARGPERVRFSRRRRMRAPAPLCSESASTAD